MQRNNKKKIFFKMETVNYLKHQAQKLKNIYKNQTAILNYKKNKKNIILVIEQYIASLNEFYSTKDEPQIQRVLKKIENKDFIVPFINTTSQTWLVELKSGLVTNTLPCFVASFYVCWSNTIQELWPVWEMMSDFLQPSYADNNLYNTLNFQNLDVSTDFDLNKLFDAVKNIRSQGGKNKEQNRPTVLDNKKIPFFEMQIYSKNLANQILYFKKSTIQNPKADSKASSITQKAKPAIKVKGKEQKMEMENKSKGLEKGQDKGSEKGQNQGQDQENEYQICELLKYIASGSYGVVYEALLDKKKVAIKITTTPVHLGNLSSSELSEILTITQLSEQKHKLRGIVQVLEIVTDAFAFETNIVFVMPYYSKNLDKWMSDTLEKVSKGSTSTKEMVDLFVNPVRNKFAFDIACGLQTLHKKHMIHLDLKPRNILINNKTNETKKDNNAKDNADDKAKDNQDTDEAKITDFGMTRMVGDHQSVHDRNSNQVVSIETRGPELLCGRLCYICDTKADVWSFGVILLLLWFNLNLFTMTPQNLAKLGKGKSKNNEDEDKDEDEEELYSEKSAVKVISTWFGFPLSFKKTLTNPRFYAEKIQSLDNPKPPLCLQQPILPFILNKEKKAQIDQGLTPSILPILPLANLDNIQTFQLPKITNQIIQGMWSSSQELKKQYLLRAGLIHKCLQVDPNKRYTMKQVCEYMKTDNMIAKDILCDLGPQYVIKAWPKSTTTSTENSLFTLLQASVNQKNQHTRHGPPEERIAKILAAYPLHVQRVAALLLQAYLKKNTTTTARTTRTTQPAQRKTIVPKKKKGSSQVFRSISSPVSSFTQTVAQEELQNATLAAIFDLASKILSYENDHYSFFRVAKLLQHKNQTDDDAHKQMNNVEKKILFDFNWKLLDLITEPTASTEL
jgi:serine/threonine protein kinase